MLLLTIEYLQKEGNQYLVIVKMTMNFGSH